MLKIKEHIRNGKKYRICLATLLIIASILLLLFLSNTIYGLFYPPIMLSDMYDRLQFQEDKYEKIIITYWDKKDNIMYRGEINDKNIVGDIYLKVCETKVKQKIWDDRLITHAKYNELEREGACFLTFIKDDRSFQNIIYIDQKYFVIDERIAFYDNKKEIADEQLFEYLNEYLKDVADEYDEDVCGGWR